MGRRHWRRTVPPMQLASRHHTASGQAVPTASLLGPDGGGRSNPAGRPRQKLLERFARGANRRILALDIGHSRNSAKEEEGSR